MDDQTPNITQTLISDLSSRVDDLEFLFNKKTGSSSNSIYGSMVNSVNFRPGVSGWQLTPDGNLEANNGNFRGDITGATGTFSGTVTVGSLNIPDATTANSMHVDTAGNTWWGANVATGYAGAPASILNTGAIAGSNFTITGGSIAGTTTVGLGNLNIAARGWSQTSAFSITDADTIAWGVGTFTAADGTAYSISAGNTGNMVAKTYIYLDTGVSTTVYQTTTTASTAVGAGKVLIAIAQNATGEATYTVLAGQGGQNIDAANIVANSITANELSTSILYAGSITLDTNGNVKGGQTAYNTGTGFFLGYSGAAYKFSIGNASSNYLTWDGTSLSIGGSYITYTAGDIVLASTTALTQAVGTSYAKFRESNIGSGSGTLRVLFDLAGEDAVQTYFGRVYRNGVAVGTERSLSSTSFTTFSEDISGWSPNDAIQIYAKNSGGGKVTKIQNFYVKAGNSLIPYAVS